MRETKEIKKYAFWNNKGGTGKTSLAFQAVCQYAKDHQKERILVIDVCPQGNLSELFLGGMEGEGSANFGSLQSQNIRKTIGGYFEKRLGLPYNIESLETDEYISTPSERNKNIPTNIDLLAGDRVLELQSNAMSSLANQQIIGIAPWLRVVDWLNDFVHHTGDKYHIIFLDLNPSFSMYTQVALAASNRVILPVMADDSSRRAILNAFSLMYGLDSLSSTYKDHAFGERLRKEKRELPKTHLIVKNRITQYMKKPASAYVAVFKAITGEVETFAEAHKEYFSDGFSAKNTIDIDDFHTAGVVAFAEGLPFYEMENRSAYYNIGGRAVQVNSERRDDAIEDIKQLSDLL